jgi:hypothetical protein
MPPIVEKLCCVPMKIGEWDTLGRARQLLQRQLAEMDATEFASHVAVNPDNGRLRILVATDLGLMDYHYSPAGSDPEGAWALRGQLHRWVSVRGLRLQSDAQLDESTDTTQSVWRLVAEDPKVELTAASNQGEQEIAAVLALARACLQHAG